MSKDFNDAEELDDPSNEEVEIMDRRMLSSAVKFRTQPFIIPKLQPMCLLELRVIFTCLRNRTHCPSSDVTGDEEALPFEAFQRAFERLFYVLQEPEGFDGKSFDENGDGFVAWGEFFRVYKKRNITLRLSCPERLYLTFNNPDSCKLASILSGLVLVTIIVSSLCFIISTMPECQIDKESCVILDHIEKACLAIFVIEYSVKLATVWAVRTEVHDKNKLQEIVVGYEPIVLPSQFIRLCRFLRAPANVIDLAAIVPGIVGTFVDADGGAFVILRLIRLTRIFRAFKNPALVAPVIVISRTVQQSTKALYVLSFNLCLGLVIFGSLMYMAEGGDDLRTFNVGGRWNEQSQLYERRVGRAWNEQEQKWDTNWDVSPFQSIPHAFWWAIVTATTVGYGDDYPTTTLGMVVAVATMLFSMVILALPVGVMGGTFSQEWDNFEQEKREKAAVLEQEMAFITSAIKKLDPSRMASLMLIEIWDDHPRLKCRSTKRRPAGQTFLGDVKLDLVLPPDREETKEFSLPVDENHEIVKRSVTGILHGKYEWVPSKSVPEKCATEDFNLRGSLKVTIKSAENLTNMDCTGGFSNPFCTAVCYPYYDDSKGDSEDPKPRMWRTNTACHTLDPVWDSTITVEVMWHLPYQRYSPRGSIPPTPPRTVSKERRPSKDATAGPLEEALGLLRSFSAGVRQQQMEMGAVRDDVRALSARVDQLSLGDTPAAQNTEELLLPNCVPSDGC